MRPDRTPNPELDPLFLAAKGLDDVPDAARDRALARARAIAAAAPRAATPSRRRLRLALAAAGVIAIGATGALAALFRAPPAAPAPALAHDGPVLAAPEPPAPAAAAPPPAIEADPAPRGHVSHRRASVAGELALIQGAQASYADGNLPAALHLLAEHARRFPHGRLAQEREALRVRSLARSGRPAEARAAFRAFAARFPDSVLLPHLRETLGAPGDPTPP